MAVEIGNLVLRGTFGPTRPETATEAPDLRVELEGLRREILAEMREMIEDTLRRQREG